MIESGREAAMTATEHHGVLSNAGHVPIMLAPTCLLLCLAAASVGHAAEGSRRPEGLLNASRAIATGKSDNDGHAEPVPA